MKKREMEKEEGKRKRKKKKEKERKGRIRDLRAAFARQLIEAVDGDSKRPVLCGGRQQALEFFGQLLQRGQRRAGVTVGGGSRGSARAAGFGPSVPRGSAAEQGTLQLRAERR